MLYWIYLLFAICFEVMGTVSMKLSQGFTRLVPSVLFILFYTISFSFLVVSLKKLDLNVAYAVWAGVGVVLVSMVGFIVLKEEVSTIKIVSIIFIVMGVIGIKYNA